MSVEYGIINVINIVFEKEELKMKKSRKLTAALDDRSYGSKSSRAGSLPLWMLHPPISRW